jgi:hypothetical protein
MKRRTLAIASALVLVLFASGRLRAKDRAQSRATGADEFFIISSVDLKKHQLVLKHPTEVTELMQVTDSTVCVDDQEGRIPFGDLRAGDTVYVTASARRDGPPVATRVRRAPMTVQELHHRYLSSFGGR